MLIRDTAVLSLGDLSFREHTDVLIQGNRVLRLGSNLDLSLIHISEPTRPY